MFSLLAGSWTKLLLWSSSMSFCCFCRGHLLHTFISIIIDCNWQQQLFFCSGDGLRVRQSNWNSSSCRLLRFEFICFVRDSTFYCSVFFVTTHLENRSNLNVGVTLQCNQPTSSYSDFFFFNLNNIWNKPLISYKHGQGAKVTIWDESLAFTVTLTLSLQGHV